MAHASGQERFEPGDFISGRYRVQEEIGRGGMGVVLRAVDTQLGRSVAIKMLLPHRRDDPGLVRRLASEARTASGLSHPAIATVFDFVEGPESTFIVYEFVDGRTLRSELSRGRFSTGEFIDAAIQLAEGLAAAHRQGIVHRDLKPENIMVAPGGDGRGRMKILDFGLARPSIERLSKDSSAVSAMTTLSCYVPGVVAGTIAYMAPEQLNGAMGDARSDLYSLGIVLYEMATGSYPFDGETFASRIAKILTETAPPITRHVPGAPVEIDRMIHKCLRQAAIERYQSAGELLTDLKNFRADSDAVKSARTEEQAALMRKLFGSAGPKPYRLWEILHIKMCLRCVLLVYLAWRFKNVTSGTWSLALFFSSFCCGTIQFTMAAVLLFAGSMEREFLRGEARKFAPWLRLFGLANSGFAMGMAVWMAEAHTILAALTAFLGLVIGITALTLKPAIDRAAIDVSNR